MGPRLTLHGLVWAALAFAACANDDDPTITENNTVVAGTGGHAAGGSVARGGAGNAVVVPQLGFAGFGRDATGMCPNPPGMTCTGSVMDYTMCLSVQCPDAYTDCYGTHGYCLSTMWCDNGCPCGDQECLESCYAKDCNSCLERLSQCAATTTCVPMTCTMGGAAGAPGLGGAGGSAGASGLSAKAAGAGGRVDEFTGTAGSR